MSEQYDNEICELEGCYGQRDDCLYLSPDYIDSAHGRPAQHTAKEYTVEDVRKLRKDYDRAWEERQYRIQSQIDDRINRSRAAVAAVLHEGGWAPESGEPAVREVRRDGITDEEIHHLFGLIDLSPWQKDRVWYWRDWIQQNRESGSRSWWANKATGDPKYGWQHFCEKHGGIRIGLVAEHEVCAYGCGVERPQARTSPGD